MLAGKVCFIFKICVYLKNGHTKYLNHEKNIPLSVIVFHNYLFFLQ
jgi:hypothetical protein